MALTAHSASQQWGRWSHPMSNDYGIMENPAMLPFDSRTSTPAHHRPIMAPQYMIPAASYSSAPMTSLSAPHYQSPAPYAFGYHGPPTPPHQPSPFKSEYADRRMMAHEHDAVRGLAYPRDTKHYVEQAPSPARSDSQVSTARSVGSNPTQTSKTITSNETINPEHRVNFETEVDELMKAIQHKAEKKEAEAAMQPLTPNMSPCPEAATEHSTPAPGDSKQSRKRYVCNGPSCNKSFTQKTHLDIHRRTHTGDKPYVCQFDGCNLTFSQLGNLKTHMRRHTGERPYSCEKCGRRFAQRGNVRAHEQTHQGLKPYVCRLDDCNKTFSQLGNMKTHQNNFHKNALKALTTKFAQSLMSGQEVPEDDRELFEYFATHYKNSNKGIKGRGKARTVAERKTKAVSQSPPAVTAQYPLPQIPQQQAPGPHQHGVSHPGSLAAYSMSRSHPAMMSHMHREHHPGAYEMFELDAEHGSAQGQNHHGLMYEEDHSRLVSFSERMY